MATNQVAPVNVTVSTLTSSDIEKDAREQDKRAGKRGGVDAGVDTVSVKTSGAAGTATAGEAKPPVKGTRHQSLKQARTNLETVLKNAGAEVKVTSNESLIEKAHTTLDSLDQKITNFLEKGGKEGELAQWEKQREEILDSLSAFEVLQADAGDAGHEVQTTSQTEGTQTQTDTGGEDFQPLWNSLEKELKTIGLDVRKGESDVELVQNKVTAQFSKELAKFKEKEIELTTRRGELETQLKETANPADKKRIETELKAVKAELETVLKDKQNLQISFLKIHESLMNYQAASDLGLAPKASSKVETRSAHVQSASAPAAASKKGGTVSTSSATSGNSPTSYSGPTGAGGGTTIGTASATGGSAPQAGAGSGVSASGGSGGAAALTTASADEGGVAVSGDTNVVGTNAMNDFSGTTLAIASTSNNLKRETRRTEEAIKKLLRAALAGNYEAIKTALIMLDKKASQTVISMGASTIKAMQNYEKQMGQLSKSMEKLSTKDASYNAKLAQINSQMNMYSMNRQAIANFLRDTMNMREEIGNLTHGVISKDGQIASSLSRWG